MSIIEIICNPLWSVVEQMSISKLHPGGSWRYIQAVVIQPLSEEQVDTYLAMLGTPVAALRKALKINPTLAALATTPLILQTLILTYQGTTVRQLYQTETALQQTIWKTYVERMIARKGDSEHYPLDHTITWLSWLARLMRGRNQTIFYLEGLQPDVLPQKYYILHKWSIRLFVGLVAGCLFGLLAGLVAGWLVGLTVGLVAGWLVGLTAGLFSEVISGREGEQLTRRELLTPNEGIQRSLKRGLSLCLIIGLLAGIAVGLISGLIRGLAFGLEVGLISGLLAGLIGGLSGGLATALEHYTLRFWLWQLGLFPWNAVSFLENATARNLLQRVGGGYSFIHRLLLDYFADIE